MSQKKNKVEPGMFVEYAYTVTNAADDSLLFEATKGHPDQMVFGASQEVIPALASAMEGLGEGGRFEITLPPQAAFGDLNPDYIMELDRSVFSEDGKLPEQVKVGAALPMMTGEGYRVVGVVKEIGDKVTMDFNHPFAGLTVTFRGEVVTVRPATEDEIHPVSGCGGCGGGCCGGGDGDCGGGDCGDGEGSCCGSKGGCCH